MRAKITLILAVVLVIYLALHISMQLLVINPMFSQLEESEAKKNMARCVAMLDREIQALDRIAADWAAWDATYQFVKAPNEHFIESNLVHETFLQNQVNLIYILNRNHKVIWSQFYDLETREPHTSVLLPDGTWPTENPLTQHMDLRGSITGIFAEGDRILMLASRPIITSQHRGPIEGTLIVGSLLTHHFLERISKQSQVRLQAWSLDNQRTRDNQEILNELKPDNPYAIRKLSNTSLHVFTLYKDLTGQPSLLMRAEVPREITAQVQEVSKYVLVSFLVGGTVLIIAFFIALRQTVLAPLVAFSDHVSKISEGDSPQETIMTERKDELGVLARSFSNVLNQLAEDKKQSAQRSYRTGKAEVTSSLLHNIRNGLHPIAAFVDLLLTDIREAPLKELEQASKEINQSGIHPTRRHQLEEFLKLSLSEMIHLLKESEETLTKILTQTRAVIKITNSHKQIKNKESKEYTSLAELVQDALQEAQRFSEGLAVNINTNIKGFSKIKIQRISLQHVLANLFCFHPETQPQSHEVTIKVGSSNSPLDDMLTLEITHARTSIDTGKLERLFERGYTVGRIIPDQGLHWCANTVNALGGRLRATQAFGGITFHLSLPLTEENKAGASS